MGSPINLSALIKCLVAILATTVLPSAHAAIVESGHSAIWYDPARNGEGLTLQVLDDDRAVLALFTFDEAGGQRWMLDVGQIVREGDDAFIRFPALTVTRGGRFGDAFDPDDVIREVVGEATLRFADCNNGTLVYTAFEQTLTIPLQRLTRTMGAGCQSPNGVPGEPVRAYAGESGSWFDLSHDGEGFLLQWMAQDEAVVVWYTYDDEGNQYWLFGSGGKREGDTIVFPQLSSARGGRFGAAFDPADVELVDWGQLELEINCSAGTVRYISEIPAFGSGTQNLTRLLQLQRPDCPWATPKLSDLYDVSLIEIPIAPGTPMVSNFILAQAVADDGTVAGTVPTTTDRKLVRWRPGDTEWTVLSEPNLSTDVWMHPNGELMLANSREPRQPVYFQNGVREPTAGLPYDISIAIGTSEDLSFVVGEGRPADDPILTPWIWDSERGHRVLPVTEPTLGSRPRAASNDGRTVIGGRVVFNCGPIGCVAAGTIGVRWINDQLAQLLVDREGRTLGGATACSADCSIVFGGTSPMEGSVRQAYFWKSEEVNGYLGTLPGAFEDISSSSYFLADTTADGSLAVGRFSMPVSIAGNLVELASGGLIWTQSTGLVSIDELLAELDLTLDWDSMAAVSVSSDGRWVLLQGDKDPGEFQILEAKAALLRLEPR